MDQALGEHPVVLAEFRVARRVVVGTVRHPQQQVQRHEIFWRHCHVAIGCRDSFLASALSGLDRIVDQPQQKPRHAAHIVFFIVA